jgi:hypothetical protein
VWFFLSQRPKPRPSADDVWEHDKFGDATTTTRDQGFTDSNAKSAKLKIENLHYEVSERELEVSRSGLVLS